MRGSSSASPFLILLVSAEVRAVPAVLMLPLEHEFASLRTTTSAALSVNILLYGLTGPFAGPLMARVGVRRVVLTALVLLGEPARADGAVRPRRHHRGGMDVGPVGQPLSARCVLRTPRTVVALPAVRARRSGSVAHHLRRRCV
ncbi:MAG: hypothetical protein ABI601_09365 [bacterium]